MSSKQVKRIVALWIDLFIAGIIFGVIENFLPQVFQPLEKDIMGIHIELQLSFAIVFYLIYFLVFDILNDGVTIGKLVLKLKVEKEDESVMSAGDHIKRTLLKMVSLIFVLITALIFLFNNSYTIHDRLARTMTIDS